MFHIFVADDNTPAHVGATLDRLPDTTGMPLFQLLGVVTKAFSSDQNEDHEMIDSQLDDEQFEEESAEEDEEDDFFGGDGETTTGAQATFTKLLNNTQSTTDFRDRIRSDLNHAKVAGFKVGHHGPLLDGSSSYVSVSCRISKLGISEEAIQAWQLDASEYLILLMYFRNGYKSVESIKACDASTSRRNIEFRVGVSHTYKPTLQETIAAFTKLSSEEEAKAEVLQAKAEVTVGAARGFRNVFISRPINELLNERLPTVVKYRYLGMHWTGAEQFYNDHQGKTFTMTSDDYMDEAYMNEEPPIRTLPKLVKNDHMTEMGEPHSFPLIAMQFLLRHIVRCTEFCLVCHCKLEDDLEALKPYVCDKPLCLYQYMSLGFGPSIEHEIISQPYVVDLLVSFCYQSAVGGKLDSFPNGLSLNVPSPSLFQEFHTASAGYYANNQIQPATPAAIPGTVTEGHNARYNRVTREFMFEKGTANPVKAGDWIVFQPPGLDQPSVHCRVVETHLFPVIKVAEFIAKPDINVLDRVADSAPSTLKTTLSTPQNVRSVFEDVVFYIYDVNFDDLTDQQKRGAIVSQLDLLPSVIEIKDYLKRNRMATLATWTDSISPTASGILRWIIASNRACIIQVDDPEQPEKQGEERLCGMDGWMQFRFAMGAPDKERRFMNSVQTAKDRLKLNHPTIFAWHGSPLMNWHSIIREGLHFKAVSHGRAFGNGCYHSLDFNTSHGYSGGSYRGISRGFYIPNTWPSSELNVSCAMALNEIVNAPNEFVSCNPHLVVAQLDWIQTRYLFVQCGTQAVPGGSSSTPMYVHDQDPSMTPTGQKGKIIIPLGAMPKSRRGKTVVRKGKDKKRQKATGSVFDPIRVDGDEDDSASIVTDVEDLNILIADEDMFVSAQEPAPGVTAKGKEPSFLSGLKSLVSKSSSKPSKHSKPMTDFVPGMLDYSTLPLLEPPAWSTPSASKRLQREFQTLLRVQETNPLHELGWYTDAEQFNNVYQWIVEFHSFEETLPLAKQMKQKRINSVVMEMRFGPDYPMSPPFVRVIRPRFLSFLQGGGGHVTAGGSICMEVRKIFHFRNRFISHADFTYSSSLTAAGLPSPPWNPYSCKSV